MKCSFCTISRVLLFGLVALMAIAVWHDGAGAAETITIEGKIVAITFEPLRPMKGMLEVKTFWGKRRKVYVGIKTKYVPPRPPVVGDKIIAQCIRVKGKLAAKKVRFKE